jgi:sulfide:quinone oxidoreductase
MMDIKTINDAISVSEQICAEDVPAIAAAGFRSILCNRPDGEGSDQPDYAEIEAAARAAGLETLFQPVVSGNVTDQDGADFRAAIAALPKPVFAYCRTGTRCAVLWSLSQAGQLPMDQIMQATRAAGYDLTALAPRLGSV